MTNSRTLEIEFNSTQLGPVLPDAGLNPTQIQLAVQMVLEATQCVIEATTQRVHFLGGNVDMSDRIPQKFSSPATQELIVAYNKVSRQTFSELALLPLGYLDSKPRSSITLQRE